MNNTELALYSSDEDEPMLIRCELNKSKRNSLNGMKKFWKLWRKQIQSQSILLNKVNPNYPIEYQRLKTHQSQQFQYITEQRENIQKRNGRYKRIYLNCN